MGGGWGCCCRQCRRFLHHRRQTKVGHNQRQTAFHNHRQQAAIDNDQVRRAIEESIVLKTKRDIANYFGFRDQTVYQWSNSRKRIPPPFPEMPTTVEAVEQWLKAHNLGPYRADSRGSPSQGQGLGLGYGVSEAVTQNDRGDECVVNWNHEYKREQTLITRVKRERLEAELVSKRVVLQALLVHGAELRRLPEELQRRLGDKVGEQAYELAKERIESSLEAAFKAIEELELADVEALLPDNEGVVPRTNGRRKAKPPADNA